MRFHGEFNLGLSTSLWSHTLGITSIPVCGLDSDLPLWTARSYGVISVQEDDPVLLNHETLSFTAMMADNTMCCLLGESGNPINRKFVFRQERMVRGEIEIPAILSCFWCSYEDKAVFKE